MKLVVDASVASKWFFRAHDGAQDSEPDTDQAPALLDAVAAGRVQLIQPPHLGLLA